MRAHRLLGFASIVPIALCASCTTSNDALDPTCPVWWEPPAKYDHIPDDMPVLVLLDKWKVDAACRQDTGYYHADADRTGRIWGCFRYIDPPHKVPEVIAPKVDAGISGYCQLQIVRHEWGHANGWPDDHRDAVPAGRSDAVPMA